MSDNPQFELLLRELDHADGQISCYMGLQMKILGIVFTFLGGAVGLLLTGRLPEAASVARLLVLFSAIGSFGVLQSSINYGIALGYMHNKECFLAPRLRAALGLQERPLFAIRAFRASPAHLPVMLSTLVIAVGVDALNLALLRRVFTTPNLGGMTQLLAVAAATLVGFVVVIQVLMGIAMKRTVVASASSDTA